MSDVSTDSPTAVALQDEDVQARVSTYVSTVLGYRRWNDSDLARVTGMTIWAISRRLAPGRPWWTEKEVELLAEEFSVPVEDILAGVPEPSEWGFAHREGA